eukprot:snap_masked-scaffold_7-processed-gene-16.22-mRNA-1 protein AED:1.00 eAED:1.00 QI:0/0/0/0/1/1/2/0/61
MLYFSHKVKNHEGQFVLFKNLLKISFLNDREKFDLNQDFFQGLPLCLIFSIAMQEDVPIKQ